MREPKPATVNPEAPDPAFPKRRHSKRQVLLLILASVALITWLGILLWLAFWL